VALSMTIAEFTPDAKRAVAATFPATLREERDYFRASDYALVVWNTAAEARAKGRVVDVLQLRSRPTSTTGGCGPEPPTIEWPWCG
jgi:hypothetical protein